MNNEFKVGQMVDFLPSQPRGPLPTYAYKILRLLPSNSAGHRRYQIKTIREAFERVALECELARCSGSVLAYR